MHTNALFYGGHALAEAVKALYTEGQTDYSLEPVVLADTQGQPLGRIEDGDAVIFCCRRGEREVQLTEAFTDPGAGGFPRKQFSHVPFVILTLYHEKFKDLPVAFAPTRIPLTLGELLSQHNYRQLHISESEKFSHVTFFFNGGSNTQFSGEKDIRIPSPRGLPPDQLPELSLRQVVEQLTSELRHRYEFILVNFANGDVIGHTQNRDAKLQCAEFVDRHLGRVIEQAQNEGYTVVITADHGNLEQMFTAQGKPHVSHTANLVPFILLSPLSNQGIRLRRGRLADIAPTILTMFAITTPREMTGTSLVRAGSAPKINRLLLVILDGWGIGTNDESNPIYLAHTPTWDKLLKSYPSTSLQASGDQVGLQPGKAGNSEAGHMNIGAGRVVLQDDARLDAALNDGTFSSNEIFLGTMRGVQQRHSRLHLIGLLSQKSSHGSIDYPLALLKMAKQQGLSDVYLHLIFDGRSTEPGSAPGLLEELEHAIRSIGIGKIVTGMGRGIALDRDGNYNKTRAAYDALVYGQGKVIITGC